MNNGKKSNLLVITLTVLITTLVVLVVGFSFLFFMGGTKKSNDTVVVTRSDSSMNKSSTIASSQSKTVETSTEVAINEKKLTTEQVEAWVTAILSVPSSPYAKQNYNLRTSVSDDDNLVYVTFGVPQTDPFGYFRINAQGNLEISLGWAGPTNWETISTKYMDTSIAENYFKEKQQSQGTNSSSSSSQSLDEDFFYSKIKKAWEDEQAYIDSIDDPKVKQSVQTAHSAAIMKATSIENDYPNQKDIINKALQRVLAGN